MPADNRGMSFHRTARTAPRRSFATLGALAAIACAGALVPAASASTPRHAREAAAIVNGTDASIAALPSLAFIDGQFPDGSGESCSGTVVAPQLILTAAHCAENIETGTPYPVSDLMVTTGSANIARSGGQSTTVTRAIIDPSFDTADQDDDAALLVLSHPVKAPAITLATTPAAAGTPGIQAGWGETNGTALNAPSVLREDSTNVLDPAACAAAWGGDFDATTELCTLDQTDPTPTGGACRGDSGGPLLADENGETVEYGLAIFVAAGCSTTDPDVYTRTDVLVGWVDTVIATLPAPAATVTPATATATVAMGPLLNVVNDAATAGRHLKNVTPDSSAAGTRRSGRSAR